MEREAMDTCTRRELLEFGGGMLLAALGGRRLRGAVGLSAGRGVVEGEPTAARVGADVLEAGGNAIDAIVAAALTAGVVAVQQCGMGGYGGHMVIALAGGKKVTAIDFNSMAPLAARPNMFPLDDDGKVRGRVNEFGWLATGVPGTLGGMQLALDLHGTRSFREMVAPAIRFARDGFPLSRGAAGAVRGSRTQLMKDPASRRLFFRDGKPPAAGSTFRNPDLARMLETLAERNSVDSFYRGDIGRRIASEFQKNGGLVTAEDMAAYHAREVKPVRLDWNGYSIHTAPLTAGGTTVIEALAILKALDEGTGAANREKLHARLELLRIAWKDRLTLFGDPAAVSVPVEHLLSDDYARKMADRVRSAVRAGKLIPAESDGRRQDGTIHLSAGDRDGNLVALTMTHGNGFGARVTVDGLGLILGHGVSRFDPRPGQANSPGPRKRPLHNMCPTVVLRGGRPVLAVGGRGGRRIPNAVFGVLSHYVGHGASMADAVAAPRLHTEGGLDARLERGWSEEGLAYLKKVGYRATRGSSAVVSAVSFDPATGTCRRVTR